MILAIMHYDIRITILFKISISVLIERSTIIKSFTKQVKFPHKVDIFFPKSEILRMLQQSAYEAETNRLSLNQLERLKFNLARRSKH